jgi:O-antigen/teichoic acid export membrane protein
MRKKIQELLHDAVLYGMGNYLSKVVGFLLIPVYTRYLTTSDYGILALTGVFGSILFVIINMGQSSAIFRSYFDSDDPKLRDAVISTGFRLLLVISLPVSLIPVFLSGEVARHLLDNPALWIFIVITAVATLSKEFARIPFAVMRAERQATRYAAFSIVRTLLNILLAIALVVGFEQGVLGVLIGQCAAEIALCLVLYPSLLASLKPAFSGKVARDLLSYGLPFVPAGLCSFLLNLSDRYFLKHYTSMEEVGLYALGYRFGEIIWLLVWAFQLAWPPFLFSNRKSPTAPQLYARVTTYYVAGMAYIWLAISVFAREVIMLMAAPSFHAAYQVVPLIALASLLHGVAFLGAVGISLERKTIYHPFIVGAAALLNVILNFLWIPTYGMMGAAYATVASFLLQCLITPAIALRFYFVPYEYARLLRIVVISGGLYFCSSWVSDASLALVTSEKALLLCLYPLLLVLTGFFLPEELLYLRRMARALRSRLVVFGNG